MRERLTARVLLLDPDDRILLMRGRLSSQPQARPAWFTIGGGAKTGETVLEAAAREIFEETGLTGVELGPVVWRREGPLAFAGELMLFQEHYVVARCPGGDPIRDGWDELERALIDDIRWWTLGELAACDDIVHPVGLIELLPDILAGRYPDTPRQIAWG